MYRSDFADIQRVNELPPEDRRHEYQYQPRPAKLIPPIGENWMLHLCTHPQCADERGIMFNRIPKKLKETLRTCLVEGTGLGWGIHFLEDWHVGLITM